MILANRFSSNDLPSNGRCDLFQQTMEDLFSVKFQYESTGLPLSGEITTYRGEHISFASMKFSPHVAQFANQTKKQTQSLFISLQKQGETFLKQNNNEITVRPGQFFIFDPDTYFSLETTDTQVYSLHLPVPSFQASIGSTQKLAGLRIDGELGSGALLRAMLDELFAMAHRLSPEALVKISRLLPGLATSTIFSLEELDEIAPRKLACYHKTRILQFVEQNLSDPELSIETIAKQVSLSTRYLHQIFEEDSAPLMKQIWAKRLDNCRKDIMSTSKRNVSVSSIAYHWGFSNTAHFSRAFRARFGIAPSELRKQVQPHPS